MEKIKIENYLGKKIICLNFSGLKSLEEISKVIEEAKPVIRNSEQNSVYVLSNIEEMHFNNKIRDMFTEFTGGNKVYVKASAIIGATGLQSFVINAINKLAGRQLKSFSDATSAKDWLASQN